PVVELQTNFGGGKTHSMLALYHMASGQLKASEAPGLESLLQSAGIKQLPKASRAVLVGTRINPAVPDKKKDGTVVHTMWGEMGWQLGESARPGGGKDGYKLMKEADEKGVSPGSDTFKELFERFGPALILIDEWVAFARQLFNVDGLPAGSFDSNMTFAQALTEGARRTKNALVVASIPASDIEIGGEGGRTALQRLRTTFGRLETVWKPATAEESFEIVRRRLFQPITDFSARDAVCQAFGQMYRQNKGEFPRECLEADYERRLKAAYPIHPELFDRLYQDWSTLDRFQRTRGVLRLMAAVIHNLWERQDRSLLIMPGMLPLDSRPVRDELTRYLTDGWSAVIDTDIDSATSRTLTLDRDNPNLQRYSACRRVARTIFIGSAPSSLAQKSKGLEEVRVKLACVQPGETPATFGDALRRLTEHLTYLYNDGTRYWFDTRPSVNRLANDRAEQYHEDDILEEVIHRLKANKNRGEFSAVHQAPASSGDVPEVEEARLVVLSPRHPYGAKLDPNPGQVEAISILENRGNSPRLYRNTLVFLAPDKERLIDLLRAVRLSKAWSSINDEKEKDRLDLGSFQVQQVEASLKRAEETVNVRLQETWCWLLVPNQEGTQPVSWEATRIQGAEDFVLRASKKVCKAEQLLPEWSPAGLQIELDRWYWKDGVESLPLKKIAEDMLKYCYLPRLKDLNVLKAAVREGVKSKDYFGYATSVKDGRYEGLAIGKDGVNIYLDDLCVLVKPAAAVAQLAPPEPVAAGAPAATHASSGGVTATTARAGTSVAPLPQQKQLLTRFHGTTRLDPTRMGASAGKIAEEIVQHLSSLLGSDVTITIEIEADRPDGFPDNVVRTVTENCNTLKFTSHGFEAS
ncbi:MAG: ATP-binding protein, partial [Candidatus Xenobia bacterium]